jgi:hypothetical protein
MSNTLLLCWRLAIRQLVGDGTGNRRLVCPPAREVLGFRAWLMRGLRDAAGARPSATHGHGASQPDDTVLVATQREFSEALVGVPSWQAAALRERIRRANSMRELWHLRVDVFSLVAVHLSQSEADARLAWLNRRFPTRGPRSGFAELGGREVH